MKQNQKSSQPKSKKQKIYSICRTSISVILTLIATIPIIYLLGTDQSFYGNQPLYSVYTQSNYFQNKVSEIQSALNNTFIVNVYSQQASEKKDGSIKQWENLREFVGFLGYYLNQKGAVTVDRLITPPQIKQQKKSRTNSNVENQILFEKAYDLDNIGQINIIRNKINKIAAGSMNRLKIKVKEPKDGSLIQRIKYTATKQILGQRIWIITIHPDYHQYHSPEELRKELNAISKQREFDRFVVVSISPADSQSKKIKYVPINIDESILGSIKDSMKKVVKAYFQFQINATRVIQTILCRSQASLLQLNHFLTRCNTTFNCYNSIDISRKNKQKDNKFASLLSQLCDKGDLDEDDDQIKSSIRQLGFYFNQEGNQEIQENLKIYYEIGNGKKCKGSKKCNYPWLKEKEKEKSKQEIKNKPTVKPIKQVKPSKKPKGNQPELQKKTTQKEISKGKKNQENIKTQIQKNKIKRIDQKLTKNTVKTTPKSSESNVKDNKVKETKIQKEKKQTQQLKKQAIPKKQVKDVSSKTKVGSKSKSNQKIEKKINIQKIVKLEKDKKQQVNNILIKQQQVQIKQEIKTTSDPVQPIIQSTTQNNDDKITTNQQQEQVNQNTQQSIAIETNNQQQVTASQQVILSSDSSPTKQQDHQIDSNTQEQDATTQNTLESTEITTESTQPTAQSKQQTNEQPNQNSSEPKIVSQQTDQIDQAQDQTTKLQDSNDKDQTTDEPTQTSAQIQQLAQQQKVLDDKSQQTEPDQQQPGEQQEQDIQTKPQESAKQPEQHKEDEQQQQKQPTTQVQQQSNNPPSQNPQAQINDS